MNFNITTRMHQILYHDLGLIDYKEGWDYQESTLKKVILEREEIKMKGNDNLFPQKQVLLLCEHPHVYTLGKSGNEMNLLVKRDFLERINAKFYKINRGGDITYHGPGQIVGYPVFDLDSFKLKIKDYIWMLEETIIQLLSGYGIPSSRVDGATGVWLDPGMPGRSRKICAIGVRVSNRVTMHGFAFNVNTDLNYFRYINPCGYTVREVTSLSKETGEEMNMEEIKAKIKFLMAGIFGIEWKMVF